MDEENNPMEDSCEEEYVCGDPIVDIRVGDEYQVEIPPMMSESERAAYLVNPLESDSSCSFVVGLPVEVMWIDTKCRDGEDDNVDMNESLKSLKTKRSRRSQSDKNSGCKQQMNLEAVPGISSSSWEDLEVDGLVLGLYTFGRNFAQVQKLLESKETGEVLSFYYGKFYKSAKYKIWSHARKKRSRRCIQGKKLYSGWRLHQLLSRLIPSIPDVTKQEKLIDVSKSFAEGKKSLEEYISAVKELVGLRSLVEAVAIGKDKEDLTVLTTEPVKSKQWFTVSSAIPAGLGAYSSLKVHEIIEKLNSRLSKTRCNDIFWDAVWPRLLARGWSSEQPKDRGYVNSGEHIVFLVPGVKKFSRRKLVKQDHYFDSISDILKKVVSEPELLEYETEEVRAPNGVIEENSCDQSNKEKHRYLTYLRSPNSSSTHMKFTVVDTTRLASGGKLCEFRELRNPNPEFLASQSNASVERFQMMPLDVDKRAKFADECKRERKRMMKPEDESLRFMIVDTSVDQGGHQSGIRRRRHLPGDENPCKIRKEAIGNSSQKQSGTNTDLNREYTKGADSGVKEETLENVRKVRSKKSKQRLAHKSESNIHHSVTSLQLPKRRRLSTCVRKDIERSGEGSVMKPPASDQRASCNPKLSVDSMNRKTDQSEETGNGTSLNVKIEEKPEIEPKGSSAQQQEQNGFGSISVVLDMHGSSKEQGALNELSSSKQQQQDESNRLCTDKKSSSKDFETAQQQEQPVQLPSKSASDKNSPSIDHETAPKLEPLELQEEEQNQQTNTDVPRRQSTRKRPLTTRALEALESGFITAKSMNTTTSKPRKRERSTRIRHSANPSNRTQGDADNGFLGNEATTSKPLNQIEDSEPSLLVNKETTTSKPMDHREDSEKVTPKLPPIVLKLPFKRG